MTASSVRQESPARRLGLVLVGLLVAVVLAGVVSHYASGDPDGLTRVAQDQGISAAEKESVTADSPLADYGTDGVESPRLSGGVAGVAGVAVTFILAGGLLLLVRRRPTHPRPEATAGSEVG